MPLNPGDVVVVPLGRRRETGVVWEPNPNLPADFAPHPNAR
ncbi:primosomal protein N' [Acetobacter orientalis]|uniref:Primosomal protein N n=1 Tax=Acetobacter orientalis TaxID=146474 RepID=A0A2Z5ZFT7_9PROT|nr:primosomal protein N' [Acetobacter orientalis]